MDDKTKILFELTTKVTKLEEQCKDIPVLKKKVEELKKTVSKHKMYVKVISIVVSLIIAAVNYFGLPNIIDSILSIEEGRIEKDVKRDILKDRHGFGGTL